MALFLLSGVRERYEDRGTRLEEKETIYRVLP
jgi:hypothetical protein